MCNDIDPLRSNIVFVINVIVVSAWIYVTGYISIMEESQDYNYEYEYLEDDSELDTENITFDDSVQLNSQVFEEILILEMQERPCLWDQRLDIKMRGMDITRKAWEEVGQAVNEDPKVCQKKWKNLRDTFLRKYKDEKSYTASGSAATNKVTTWKYYKQMKFLKPTTEHRRTFSNVQMVNDVNEEFCRKKNTDTILIEDETSSSLLTVQKKRPISTSSMYITSPSSRSLTPSSSMSCSSLKRKNFEET